MTTPAIRVLDLRVVRGGVAVIHGLTCDVAAGSVTGLLGPSGSGKSTLLQAIVGVQKIAGDSVDVLGQPGGSASLRTRLGYMTVYGDVTVRENLVFFARAAGLPGATVGGALAEVGLASMEIRSSRASRAGSESASRLRRRCWARPTSSCWTSRPSASIPSFGAISGASFTASLRRVRRCSCRGHVMDEADRCDALLLLREGRLLAEGTPTELRARTGEDRERSSGS